jgi:MFS family permease
VLAKRTLHAGPQTYGLLMAFFGGGALLGALLAAALGRASVKLFLLGSAGFAAAELLLAESHSVGAAELLLFTAGVCFTTWTSSSNSTLQLQAPDHLRGRVVGLYYYAFNGFAPLGGLLAGWLSARGGTELAFAVSGAIGVAMSLLAAAQLRDRSP